MFKIVLAVRSGLTTWTREKRYFNVFVIAKKSGTEWVQYCEFEEDTPEKEVQAICQLLNDRYISTPTTI